MRRGMSLIELLAVLPMLLAVMLVFSGLFYTSLEDVPKLQQVANVNGVLSHMLERLQRDVDEAESLPESASGKTAGEKLLLIRSPSGVIYYEVKAGEIIREDLTAEAARETKRTYTWPVPGAKVSFRKWQSSGSPYAVEVRHAVEYSKQKYSEDKLANTRVFYLASIPGQREEQ